FQQTARMSQYNKNYMDPVLEKAKLVEGLEENDLRKHRPIKAPNTDCSISPLFYDAEIQKFTNMIMQGGNKERVREIMRRLFENLKHTQVAKYNRANSDEERQGIECNPIAVFHQAVDNCKPLLLSKRTVKGGIAYRVPVCAKPIEQRFNAMKWIIESCRDRTRRIPMEDKLTMEIMDAYKYQGKAIRKKQETHKICESNRAYAHLR
ncbi:unnamed protein product, partial [Candidula unifasciata]